MKNEHDYKEFEDIVGKTIASIKTDQYDINCFVVFTLTNGKTLTLYHSQDCCESVWLGEIIGDLSDLIGTPITLAECVTEEFAYGEWTFYKLSTYKGSVTLRFCGEDTYYSIAVSAKWA